MADTKEFDLCARKETQAAAGRTRRKGKRHCVLFAALFAALAAVPFSNAQSPQQTNDEPTERVTAFYKWVLGTMVKKRTPVAQKKTVAGFLSKSLYRWLYLQDRETRNLYFLASNDWLDSRIGDITIVDSRIAADRAVVKVDLGKPEPPDDFVDHLRINLRQENGEWKIDCIQDGYLELGGPIPFDPKYDPPGCKPVSFSTKN